MTDSPEFDQLIQNYEFDNEQYLKCIERENQLIKNFTRDIELTNLSVKRLQESVSQIDEDTKRVHKQYTMNRDNCSSLKKTSILLSDHEDSLRKKLEINKDKYSEEMNERHKLLEHYQSIWEDFEKKYKSLKPAQILEKEMKNLSLTERFLGNIQDEKEHLTNSMKENKLLTTQEVKDFISNIARVKTDSNSLKDKIKILKGNISEMKQMYQRSTEVSHENISSTTSGVANVSPSPTTITTTTSSIANTKTNFQQSQHVSTPLSSSSIVRSIPMKFPSPKPISKEITTHTNVQLPYPLIKHVNVPKYEEFANISRTTKCLPVSISGVKPACSSMLLPKSPVTGTRPLWAFPATSKSQFQDISEPLTVPARNLQLQGPMSALSLSSSSMDKLKKVTVPITAATTTPNPSSMSDAEHFQMQAPSPQLASFCSSPGMKNLQMQKMTSSLQPTLGNIQQASKSNEIEAALSQSNNNINKDAFQENTFDYNEHQRMLKRLHSSPGIPSMSHRPMFLQSNEDKEQKTEAAKGKTDTNFFLHSFYEKQDQNEESLGVSMFPQSNGANNAEGHNIFSGFSQSPAADVDTPLDFRFSNSNEDMASNQNESSFFSFNTNPFPSNDQDSGNNFSFDFTVSPNMDSGNSTPFSLF